MKGKYKRKRFWCSKCDAEMAAGGAKCANCGHRNVISKVKKPSMNKLLKDEPEYEDEND